MDIKIIDLDFRMPVGGIVISIVGVVFLLLSILQLNKNLSPFPSPKKNGQLVQNGVYSLVRHPIYLGILIAGFGYSLFSGSLYRLMVTGCLFVLFHFKSEYEEAMLSDKFEEYKDYQDSTPKLIPFGRSRRKL